MFGTQDLWLFVVSGLLLNIAPGPDSLLIMARSASQGFKAGAAAVFGICTGTCVHILAAAIGLSAVLATSAEAFLLIKLLGAGYLLYIGIQMLRARSASDNSVGSKVPVTESVGKIFRQGLLTNVLNPKVALFFLAFLPQFVAPDAPSKAEAFLFLGAIFNFNGMLWCLFLAWSSAVASQKVQASARVKLWLNRLIGGLFITLGFKLALSRAEI
ncbi:LysE family translocator [Rheinheimera riviphila]|uniref:LysE family translocator n=1 Tax=Rheinheimera riviphila TaxID=1834037 RepID=A0A437R2I1_9GAMM|nr:LysE family translocator [Rheinheimera riviphila]RVU40922.1 LysE family translocator [Rheinheimera riviphila]